MSAKQLATAQSKFAAAVRAWDEWAAAGSPKAADCAAALAEYREANAEAGMPVRIPSNALEFLLDALPADLWNRLGDPRRARGVPAAVTLAGLTAAGKAAV